MVYCQNWQCFGYKPVGLCVHLPALQQSGHYRRPLTTELVSLSCLERVALLTLALDET